MNRRIVKWSAVVLVGFLTVQVFAPLLGTKSQPVTPIDPMVEEYILRTTVQIRLFAPLPATQPDCGQAGCGDPCYVMAQGFGTMVLWEGATVIVTHNHWGDMLKDAQYVHILDAYGNLLLKLWMNEFASLIRYSDPGTLVLDAPAGLSLASADLGIDQSVAAGDIVTVVRQDPADSDRVDLLQARVLSFKQYHGLPVFKLAILGEGSLVPGDSGGGIWFHGELVGNTWASFIKPFKLPMLSETGFAAPLPPLYFQNGETAQTLSTMQHP